MILDNLREVAWNVNALVTHSLTAPRVTCGEYTFEVLEIR